MHQGCGKAGTPVKDVKGSSCEKVEMPQIGHHKVTKEPVIALVVIILKRGRWTRVGVCLTLFTATVLM